MFNIRNFYLVLYRTYRMIAERRERSERSEANNRVLFEIPRYLYIYIYILYNYMSVCKCIVQDRAHLTQVLSRRHVLCAMRMPSSIVASSLDLSRGRGVGI